MTCNINRQGLLSLNIMRIVKVPIKINDNNSNTSCLIETQFSQRDADLRGNLKRSQEKFLQMLM